MNGTIEDSTWGVEHIKKLDEFEDSRNLVLRATKHIFLDFYRNNFRGNERVLEVGSGTGFLRRNWPDEFQGKWIQTDSQPAFLEDGKRRFPSGSYVSCSVYDTPFANESFDVVCGFGSFDVFMDLENAVREAHRVLKNGGLFFHMLDLFPCSEPVLQDLRQKKLPFQVKGWHDSKGNVKIEEISFIGEGQLPLFNEENSQIKYNGKKDNFHKNTRLTEKLFDKYGQIILEHEYFNEKLTGILKNYFPGTSIESGKLSAKYTGKRTREQLQEKGHPFVFHWDAGRQYYARTLNGIIYNILSLISLRFLEQLEPNCKELSSVRYVKTMKT